MAREGKIAFVNGSVSDALDKLRTGQPAPGETRRKMSCGECPRDPVI